MLSHTTIKTGLEEEISSAYTLPMPAMNFWSINNKDFSAHSCRRAPSRTGSHDHCRLERIEPEVLELFDPLLQVPSYFVHEHLVIRELRGSTKQASPWVK